MQNLYNKIVTYKGDFKHCLQLLGMLDIFEPIFEHYPKEIHESAAMYIINAYSTDSPLLYVGGTWSDIKKNCAKQAALPAEYWNNFVFLGDDSESSVLPGVDVDEDDDDDIEKLKEKEPTVSREQVIDDRLNAIIDAITAYVNFRGNRNQRHLLYMYDLYEELMEASVSRIKKGQKFRDIDYESKRKNMKEATELLEEIKEFEKKIAVEDAGLQKAREEIANKSRMVKEFRAETWAR